MFSTAMPIEESLFRASFKLARALIGQARWRLLALFGVASFLVINLGDFAAGLSPTQENLRLSVHLFLALWDLIEGFLLLLILSWTIPLVRPLAPPRFLTEPFDRPYLVTYLAEYLRVLGRILLWGLLLIIPGCIKSIQYSLVPFVVFFSADYEKGEVDALELSRKLVKPVFWPIAAIIFGFGFIQLSIELLVHFRPEFHTLPVRLPLDALSFLISVWSYSLMLELFVRQMEKK